MAIGWETNDDDDKSTPLRQSYTFSEPGVWSGGVLRQITGLEPNAAQESIIQQYTTPGIWEPKFQWVEPPKPLDTDVTISISQGNINEEIKVKPQGLLPKNRFKLHQKIDALIKKAYN